VAKIVAGALVALNCDFDYSLLSPKKAANIQRSANRIRGKVKCTIEDIITIGQELLLVKEELPHGQFGPWLLLEFGWVDRTARNFMAVAEQFGPKTEMISDLAISPTAAYLLASASTPWEARQTALDRAIAGEQITASVARELIGVKRKTIGRNRKVLSADEMCDRVEKVLSRIIMQCNPKHLSILFDKLRAFAKEKETERGGHKNGAQSSDGPIRPRATA